jgi:hypothetical protein
VSRSKIDRMRFLETRPDETRRDEIRLIEPRAVDGSKWTDECPLTTRSYPLKVPPPRWA